MPSPDDRRLLYLVKRVQYISSVLLDRALQPFGVTAGQYQIIESLARRGSQSSARLSRTFGVTPQTMFKQISALAANGVVERRKVEGNRRTLDVSLTRSGRATLRRCNEAVDALERALFGELDPAEVAAYRAFMERFLEAHSTADLDAPAEQDGADGVRR